MIPEVVEWEGDIGGKASAKVSDETTEVDSYPTPATNDGIERVLAKPVRPPTMQSPPIVYAGYADYGGGESNVQQIR